METNFFQQIAALQIDGDLHIIIGKGAENKIVVSVLLNNEQCGDTAKNLIPPLILRETPQELDKGFFSAITSPVKSTSQLLINMESFIKQQENAKTRSAMEKEKGEKDKKEKEARDKNYREAMAKADELEKAGKYREAWVKVPEPVLFPEHIEAIQKRRSALASKFAPDLFASDPPQDKPKMAEDEQEEEPMESEWNDDEQEDE